MENINEVKKKRGRPRKIDINNINKDNILDIINKEIEQEQEQNQVETIENFDLLIKKLISYPYEILKDRTGFQGFELTDTEKEINYQLSIIAIPSLVEYFERYSLLLLIIFNILILSIKFYSYYEYKKGIKEQQKQNENI